jgi:glycosyltransferase involved in cell wall biosynthesis
VKVLVVGPYPPRRCGIGAYAATQVARLRETGHQVAVLSPRDGEGDVRVPFFGGRPFLRAVRAGRGRDRIVVHFQPSLYYRPRRPVSKVFTSLGLLWLVVRRPRTEILVHEADVPSSRGRPDYLILGLALRRARLAFHTEAERRLLEERYGFRARAARLVPHGEGVAVHFGVSREAARTRLGVDPAGTLFVCAGFVHPDKGFDRAVEAFAARGTPPQAERRRLVIVGSVRDPSPANLAYADRLRELCEGAPGVTLVGDFVSDETLDLWITAADRLILPYRRSWSSGVLARAQRLGTPAVVAPVGGLPEQAGEKDVVFESDEELVQLLSGSDREIVAT